MTSVLGLIVSLNVYAEVVTLDSLQKAIAEGQTFIAMRYHYELVDQGEGMNACFINSSHTESQRARRSDGKGPT